MRAQTPSAHTTPASMPNVPTQIQPEYAVLFLPALHTGYILLKRHIARVDQHSSIARLGVGGTGGSH